MIHVKVAIYQVGRWTRSDHPKDRLVIKGLEANMDARLQEKDERQTAF